MSENHEVDETYSVQNKPKCTKKTLQALWVTNDLVYPYAQVIIPTLLAVSNTR